MGCDSPGKWSTDSFFSEAWVCRSQGQLYLGGYRATAERGSSSAFHSKKWWGGGCLFDATILLARIVWSIRSEENGCQFVVFDKRSLERGCTDLTSLRFSIICSQLVFAWFRRSFPKTETEGWGCSCCAVPCFSSSRTCLPSLPPSSFSSFFLPSFLLPSLSLFLS